MRLCAEENRQIYGDCDALLRNQAYRVIGDYIQEVFIKHNKQLLKKIHNFYKNFDYETRK